MAAVEDIPDGDGTREAIEAGIGEPRRNWGARKFHGERVIQDTHHIVLVHKGPPF